MWRQRAEWAELTSRHHGFGRNRGEYVSFFFYQRRASLPLYSARRGVRVDPAPCVFTCGGAKISVSRCILAVKCLLAARESCAFVLDLRTTECRKMLRPGTWMISAGAFWGAPWSSVIHGLAACHSPYLCPALSSSKSIADIKTLDFFLLTR